MRISQKNLLIFLIIVVMLGVAGYLLYQNNEKANNPTYDFEMKDLGLKMKITGDIQDLLYIPKDLSGNKVVLFSTKKLEQKGGLNCSVVTGAIGVIELRQNVDVKSLPSPYLVKAGDTYVMYSSPQSPCSDDKSTQELQEKQLQSMKKALKTLEKI